MAYICQKLLALFVFDMGYFCGNGHVLSNPSGCNMSGNVLRLCLAEGKLGGQKSGRVNKSKFKEIYLTFHSVYDFLHIGPMMEVVI